MAVPIETEPRFEAGTPKVLFEGPCVASARNLRPYGLTPDGKRFVMLRLGDGAADRETFPAVVDVQNWGA